MLLDEVEASDANDRCVESDDHAAYDDHAAGPYRPPHEASEAQVGPRSPHAAMDTKERASDDVMRIGLIGTTPARWRPSTPT